MYIRIRKPNLNPSLMPFSSAPLLACLAEESDGHIDLRVLLRSEYPILRAAYQSDGKNSIPKLIYLDAATLTESGQWSPWPATAKALSHRLHAEVGVAVTQLIKQMNTWSDEDQAPSLQHELLDPVAAWRAQKF